MSIKVDCKYSGDSATISSGRTQLWVYLVGWFLCDQWDSEDPRKRATPPISMEDARQRFNAQGAALSVNGIKVEAVVIDAALR